MPTNTSDAWRVVGPAADLVGGDIAPFYLHDLKRRIGVTRTGDGLYAVDGLCTADGCALSAGLLVDHAVVCPCDGSTFSLRDGTVVRGPATVPLRLYAARVRDGSIEISLP